MIWFDGKQTESNGEESMEIREKDVFKIVTILMTVLIVSFIVYGIQLGIFQDNKVLIHFVKQFGWIGPLVFILIQIIQVIFPVIPGGASCLAGVLAFGPVEGFIYNYIGLCIGSIASYMLSSKYGEGIIRKFFSDEQVDKYLNYIRTERFNWIFALGILLPGAPDDLLCYVAGVSNLKLKDFIWIILIGKPLTLLGYSLFMNVLPIITTIIK